MICNEKLEKATKPGDAMLIISSTIYEKCIGMGMDIGSAIMVIMQNE